MKILGFVMGNKILTAIVVIALVGAMYLYTTGQSIDDVFGGTGEVIDESAPQLSITMDITKAETNDQVSADILLDDDVGTPVIDNKLMALTTVNVGVPFVEPTSAYNIAFSIGVIGSPESPAVTSLDGTVTIAGVTATGRVYENSESDSVLTVQKTAFAPDVETTFSFPLSNDKSFHTTWASSDGNMLIMGSDIHDSTFTIAVNVESSTDASVFGATSLDIVLKVGEGGTIEVTIGEITATPIG